jgi:glycosyltransferase involved in cell wall biosynthesis
MRVCVDLAPLLCASSRCRGIGAYVRQLARALVRAGPLLDGIDLLFLVADGGALRLVPGAEVAPALVAPTADAGRAPTVSDPVYWALKHTMGRARLGAGRLDLYHSTDPLGTPRVPRCPTVQTCHDLIPVLGARGIARRARLAVDRLRYGAAARTIAVSHCTRRDLVRLLRLPEDRVEVVHHGVDGDLFQAAPREGEAQRVAATLGTERPYFLYVGGLDRRKQVPELAESFGRCAGGLAEVLVVVGEVSGAQRDALLRAVERGAGRGRVLFPGFVSPALLPALYRQATAHLMMSVYEGFGLTVVEAMACGCPVVAARASSVPEIAGDAALLVEPGSPRAMDQALVQIASSEALRADLRARGLSRAALFSWERCVAQTIEVYRSVLGGTGARVPAAGGGVGSGGREE